QNLILGLKPGRNDGDGRWSIADMFRLFENLGDRADVEASALSGGEQQMLAVCRTLMGDPDLIMVDEPSEGLSPQMAARLRDLLEEIARRGVAILLVEQKLTMALEISDRLVLMGQGRVVFDGQPSDLAARADLRQAWLEV
ncbi:MAG: ATP-binding cassette domain-containing protein, partial [Pseudomonadota bacterium]